MRIVFQGVSPASEDELARNVRHSKGLGLPVIREQEPHGRRLAIVGGGPSIVDSLDELRGYTDVWAINGACRFLRGWGISSTLLSVDPVDFLAPRVCGARKALLATRCHPKVFEALKDADVKTFDVNTDADGGLWASGSTATVVFQLATMLGYRRTVFYGCEGSYQNKTHAYMDEKELQDLRFVVECGGEQFHTSPDLYIVTTQMAAIMRLSINESFTERSGGLLRALIANPAHEVVDVSDTLAQSLVPLEQT